MRWELRSPLKNKNARTVNDETSRAPYEAPEARVSKAIPLSALKDMVVNLTFAKRGFRICALGLLSPLKAPKLWFLICFNLGMQIGGAFVIQTMLYPVATGRDASYPGISGCLKSGCGGNATRIVPAPGDTAVVADYLVQFAWMFFLSMTLVTLMSYSGDLINSCMRQNVATSVQKRLLTANNKLLYRLTVDGSIDNVDQRITSDLQAMLDGFVCVLFGNSADYLAYPMFFCITRLSCAFGNCFNLKELHNYDNLKGQVIGVDAICIGIALVAYILPVNLVSSIFFRGQRYEGDFRKTHTRAVLNGEQISLLHGEGAERALADDQYNLVDMNNRHYYSWQGVLLILRLIVTVSYPEASFIALSFINTKSSTTANFFQKQMGDVLEYSLYFPVFVERLAFACGATHRVGQLLEMMDLFESKPVAAIVEYNPKRIELRNVWANPPVIAKENVRPKPWFSLPWKKVEEPNTPSVAMPDGHKKSLFENVSLVVDHGQSVCIIGPSGCGKSSLLRVIGGLWGIDEGLVVRPESVCKDGIFFLPQRPYVFPGSLEANINYPIKASGIKSDTERAESILRLVHLGHLVDKYSMVGEENWAKILSTSEMQRLNFARMFFHKPAFCLADECTSSLDLRMESFLYGKCKELGISMISVAHRPTVVPHHDFVFEFKKATRSWHWVLASKVATCEKFPTDGLEVLPVQEAVLKVSEEVELEGFNLNFIRRFLYAVSCGVPGLKSLIPLLLLIQLCCMLIYAYMTIEIFRDYGTSIIIAEIIAGQTGDAVNKAAIIIGLSTVISIMQALSCFCGAMIAIRIHRGVIKRFHTAYFTPGVLYYTNNVLKIDGIDQRMVQDLSGLREALAWLFGSPFAYCNYRVGALPLTVVWITLTIYAFITNWQLSLFFLIFMVACFILQLVTSNFTAKLVNRRQAFEGDLRLNLGRVLQNIESITFFGGEAEEYAVTENMLGEVFHARLRYNHLINFASVPTIVSYYWLQTGVYVMAAILQLWFAPGVIKSADLFTTINFNITWAKVTQLIIQCLGGFGMIVGFTHRIIQVLDRTEQAQAEVDACRKELKISQGSSVAMDKVAVAVPGIKSFLIDQVSMQVPGSVCISGHGKSSIVRILAGLWPVPVGQVSRPAWGTGGIFFVPQSNYATQGTLAAQVVYPSLVPDVKPSDEHLTNILNEVGLDEILSRWGLHRVVDWNVVLSGGECQRLGFARVLYHLPKVAVLDEITSALDMALEKQCMNALLERSMSLISCAARPSIAEYHDKELTLKHTKTKL